MYYVLLSAIKTIFCYLPTPKQITVSRRLGGEKTAAAQKHRLAQDDRGVAVAAAGHGEVTDGDSAPHAAHEHKDVDESYFQVGGRLYSIYSIM